VGKGISFRDKHMQTMKMYRYMCRYTVGAVMHTQEPQPGCKVRCWL
jgi:hypothetical protein